MQVSTRGAALIGAFEGFASRAYRCPAGVVTIGYGFTMGSRVFANWWREHHGGAALRIGDTIARADADRILAALLNREYGAAVTTRIGTPMQHEHDGAASVAFNCGTGSLAWRWAQALKRGAARESAKLLRTTAVTANGRRLAGLVRRRAAEARLIEHGDYGNYAARPVAPSVSTERVDVKWYQERLAKLGYRVGVDGVHGSETERAVATFQRDHGLKIDGIVGPATRATIIRALDAKTASKTTGGAATGGAVAGGGVEGAAADPAMADIALQALLWGLGAAVVVFVVFLIWRHRGRITGQRVPT